MVNFLPKIPYTHRIYMVLANPTQLTWLPRAAGTLQRVAARNTLGVTAATSLGWRRGTGRQLTKQPVHVYACMCVSCAFVRLCVCAFVRDSCHQFGVAERYRPSINKAACTCVCCMYACMCVSCACMFVRDSCHQFGVAERYRPSINKAACTCVCMYVCVVCVYVCA